MQLQHKTISPATESVSINEYNVVRTKNNRNMLLVTVPNNFNDYYEQVSAIIFIWFTWRFFNFLINCIYNSRKILPFENLLDAFIAIRWTRFGRIRGRGSPYTKFKNVGLYIVAKKYVDYSNTMTWNKFTFHKQIIQHSFQ